MILEVNNTFDERRLYFLKGSRLEAIPTINDLKSLSDKSGSQQAHEVHRAATEWCYENTTKFASSWPKDFHVSPFNSRKGSYTLSALDPFSQGKVNNIITLSSSKDHPKLVAKIISTGDFIDPCEMGTVAKLRFVATWWWVGFVTFPRIVREAAKLFFHRKLHVWYRPEVLRESIGRKGIGEEKSEPRLRYCRQTSAKL